MLLGTLIDAGVPENLLRNAASSLNIGAELRIEHVHRGGFRAVKVDVLEPGQAADPHAGDDSEEAAHPHGSKHNHDHTHDHSHAHTHDPAGRDEHTHTHQHDHSQTHSHAAAHPHVHSHVHGRNWPQIRELIHAAPISAGARRIALRAFELLAEAEAKAHGIAVEEVHFHEVGAVDTIADIVSSAVGLDWLAIDRWFSTPVNVGSGFVQCAHGRLPVPAPATAELLKGVPIYSAGPAMELTTPTGAAMLRALNCEFNLPSVPFAAAAIGYGAGGRDPEGFANVLRLSVGTEVVTAIGTKTEPEPSRASFSGDRVVVLECALDDATPQVIAHTMELALEHGALDVMAAPVTMKKSRLGTLVTVLCRPADEDALEDLLFRETTTLGIRRREEERVVLARESVVVDTPYGKIRVKIASRGGEVLNAMPEYDDCRRAAREHNIPIRTVMEAASAAYAALQIAKAEA